MAAKKFLQNGAGGGIDATFQQVASSDIVATPFFNVQDPIYGALGNGSTDDTTAIQAAITAAQTSPGGVVWFPAGTYKITSSLTVTAAVVLLGAGAHLATLAPATFFNAISINTALAVTVRDLSIQYAASATSAAIGINVTAGAAAENVSSRFENLYIFGAFTGINFAKASHWIINSCLIQSFTSNGVLVANTNNIDSGDNTIVNCEFLSAGIGGTLQGIHYNSSGGLRIENCKINQVTTGVFLDFNGTTAASDLAIIGCSIEGTSMTSGFAATRSNATGTFQNLVISSNNFEVQGSGGLGINIPLDANGNWLFDVNISNNIFFLSSAGSPVGIDIASTSGLCALNNNYVSQIAATIAQIIQASVSTGLVGLNCKRGTFAASVNNSGTTTTVAPF